MRFIDRIRLGCGSTIELLYVCPNALVRYMPTCIDMSCIATDETYDSHIFSPLERQLACPMSTVEGHVCYKYKREEAMKPVEARRFGENNVAVNDIVEIKIGSAYIENALYKYLGNKRTVIGRLVSFEDHCVVVDVSEQYQSKQLDICYDQIVEIKDVTKEMITP